MASKGISGVAVASVGIGSLLLVSGIKGWSLLAAISDVIIGKSPKQNEVYPLTAASSSSSGGASSSGNSIASDAMQYQGHTYAYGGAPGTSGKNPWDCSSFVNWVCGHDLKLSIPGYANGSYTGSVHGPTTVTWGAWSGITHITAAQVQAGDLIIWLNHMGIATSNTEMISALDSQQGTIITPIQGYGNGPLLCYGRFT